MNQEALNVEIRCYRIKKCSEDREWESKVEGRGGKKREGGIPKGKFECKFHKGRRFFHFCTCNM